MKGEKFITSATGKVGTDTGNHEITSIYEAYTSAHTALCEV